MKSKYTKLALCDNKNECARTDTVFFPISQVYTRGVTLCQNVHVNLSLALCIYVPSFMSIFKNVDLS